MKKIELTIEQQELFMQLYAGLTSAQIEKALRSAKLTHRDWLAFVRLFRD
ncbi:hypothetical protein [Cohnella soli]|uniref:Uncharacterized protein n=1 Tax=Cohnella soli TaxID=425005 RepID=A0ABW0HM62_9BACL